MVKIRNAPVGLACAPALPGGAAATFGVAARGFGSWVSAHSAAYRLRSDLVRLREDGR